MRQDKIIGSTETLAWRGSVAIAYEGVASLRKVVGNIPVRKRNQMPHPCVWGVVRSGAAMGMLNAASTPH
jgi:hypothetical protein